MLRHLSETLARIFSELVNSSKRMIGRACPEKIITVQDSPRLSLPDKVKPHLRNHYCVRHTALLFIICSQSWHGGTQMALHKTWSPWYISVTESRNVLSIVSVNVEFTSITDGAQREGSRRHRKETVETPMRSQILQRLLELRNSLLYLLLVHPDDGWGPSFRAN